MADPFEVRMRFTSQLQGLNASVNSAQKAAQYALKYRDMDEDLHSCILEQVERVRRLDSTQEKPVLTDGQTNMNTRANIMFFIEHFLDQAQRDGHSDYVRMMQRDIIRVVDAVAPDDGSGAANVKVVRKVSTSTAVILRARTDRFKVLHNLQSKGLLEVQVVTQIEDVIKERETTNDDSDVGSPNGGLPDAPPSQTIPRSDKKGAPPRLEKRQIEQRIEEDRERHKRQRESIWAVPAGQDQESTKLWEETSEYGEDDDRLVAEEARDFEAEMEMQRCHHRQQITNGQRPLIDA